MSYESILFDNQNSTESIDVSKSDQDALLSLQTTLHLINEKLY